VRNYSLSSLAFQVKTFIVIRNLKLTDNLSGIHKRRWGLRYSISI